MKKPLAEKNTGALSQVFVAFVGLHITTTSCFQILTAQSSLSWIWWMVWRIRRHAR